MAGKFGLNFWQDTGFGSLQYEASGWVGVFTGWYFPLDLREGTYVGFLWPYTDRTIYTSSSFSAQVNEGSRDYNRWGISLGGNIWPLLRESGAMSNRFSSGQVVQDNVDIDRWRLRLSGQATGDTIEKPFFYSQFSSGSVVETDKDICFRYLTPTADVSQINFETGVVRLSFYATFTRPDYTGMTI